MIERKKARLTIVAAVLLKFTEALAHKREDITKAVYR